MKTQKAKKDLVLPDQSAHHITADPLGINPSPEEVKRKFDRSGSGEEVSRQRAYDIYEQQGRQEGYALESLVACGIRTEIDHENFGRSTGRQHDLLPARGYVLFHLGPNA